MKKARLIPTDLSLEECRTLLTFFQSASFTNKEQAEIIRQLRLRLHQFEERDQTPVPADLLV